MTRAWRPYGLRLRHEPDDLVQPHDVILGDDAGAGLDQAPTEGSGGEEHHEEDTRGRRRALHGHGLGVPIADGTIRDARDAAGDRPSG